MYQKHFVCLIVNTHLLLHNFGCPSSRVAGKLFTVPSMIYIEGTLISTMKSSKLLVLYVHTDSIYYIRSSIILSWTRNNNNNNNPWYRGIVGINGRWWHAVARLSESACSFPILSVIGLHVRCEMFTFM